MPDVGGLTGLPTSTGVADSMSLFPVSAEIASDQPSWEASTLPALPQRFIGQIQRGEYINFDALFSCHYHWSF